MWILFSGFPEGITVLFSKQQSISDFVYQYFTTNLVHVKINGYEIQKQPCSPSLCLSF